MRPVADTWIAAARTWLPPGQGVDEAIRRGRTTSEDRDRNGYEALRVGVDPGPVMAVRAARDALAGSGVAPGDLDAVFHAWIYHQGHDFWSPAHYVAQQLEAATCIAVGVQQMCNGGAAAIDLALGRMAAVPATRAVLVTTGDRFASAGFDRWAADYGVAYGDGATAVVLGRDGGDLKILASVGVAAPELEGMHRGDDRFSPAPRMNGAIVDVRRTKKAYLARHGSDRFARTCARSLRQAIGQALEEAAIDPSDVDVVALPRLGRAVLDDAYLPVVADLVGAPVADYGRGTGHLGAGDLAANLAELIAAGSLGAGRTALLVSGGAGFSWNVLIVRGESAR